MRTLSVGKARALGQCSTSDDIFTILAADHRDAMRVMIDAVAPQNVPAQMLTEIKVDIVRHLARDATAVLLDPLYSMDSIS